VKGHQSQDLPPDFLLLLLFCIRHKNAQKASLPQAIIRSSVLFAQNLNDLDLNRLNNNQKKLLKEPFVDHFCLFFDRIY